MDKYQRKRGDVMMPVVEMSLEHKVANIWSGTDYVPNMRCAFNAMGSGAQYYYC